MNNLVNDPDARKRDNHSAQTVDQQIPAQQARGSSCTILHSAQGQWNQRNDDERIENGQVIIR